MPFPAIDAQLKVAVPENFGYGAGKQSARRATGLRVGAQMETLNFTSGIAMKLTVGLKDGLKISWMPGVIVLFGVSAMFQ